MTSRQRDWTARGGLGRAVDAVGVTAVTIVPLVVAYLLAGSSGYWSNPNFVPAVGVYGVGLAAVGYLGVYAAVGPITAAPGWNSGPVPLSTGEFPPSVPNPRRVGAACSRLLLVSASPVAISFLLAVGPAGSALAGVAPALWESAAARASGVFLVALIAGSGLAAIVARTAVLRRGTPHRSAPAAPSFPVGVLALVLVAVLVPGFVAGPLIEIGVLLGFSTMFPAVMVGMRPRRDDAVAAAIPETTRQAMPVDAPADGLGYETVVVAACALGGVVLPAMFAASWMGHL